MHHLASPLHAYSNCLCAVKGDCYLLNPNKCICDASANAAVSNTKNHDHPPFDRPKIPTAIKIKSCFKKPEYWEHSVRGKRMLPRVFQKTSGEGRTCSRLSRPQAL